MNLKEAKENHTYTVMGMELPVETERRLCVLGLTQNSKIYVMSNRKKGAIIVRIRGCRYAFGKNIAEHIFVA